MNFSFSALSIILPALYYLVPLAVALFVLKYVIRSAVESALRRHQLWLEDRHQEPPLPTGAID